LELPAASAPAAVKKVHEPGGVWLRALLALIIRAACWSFPLKVGLNAIAAGTPASARKKFTRSRTDSLNAADVSPASPGA
jgi:hypothetical protein